MKNIIEIVKEKIIFAIFVIFFVLTLSVFLSIFGLLDFLITGDIYPTFY